MKGSRVKQNVRETSCLQTMVMVISYKTLDERRWKEGQEGRTEKRECVQATLV